VKELRSKVLTYPHFTVFDDVGFQLGDDGLVVLTGYVTEPFKKAELEERVAKVTGVRQLDNVIEVLPVGASDQRLREALFNNIYRNDLFAQYANRAQPPVHIIVKNSNVMLTGAVANRIEKVQAENIARSTFGVIKVDNRLEVSR
jgi:osmotically-inducible protein OsmY